MCLIAIVSGLFFNPASSLVWLDVVALQADNKYGRKNIVNNLR
jgi:hypothetical protein